MQQLLNITLRLEGTDFSGASWSITDLRGVGWLTMVDGAAGEIPSSSELQEVKQLPLAASPQTSPWPLPSPCLHHHASHLTTQVNLRFIADTTGLREETVAYTTTVQINVTSQQPASFEVPVSLLVSASTNDRHIVWGEVRDAAVCGAAGASSAYEAETRNQAGLQAGGSVSAVAFTACDVDRLPVRHQLPSAGDGRSWRSALMRVGARGAAVATSLADAAGRMDAFGGGEGGDAQPIIYVGDGI